MASFSQSKKLTVITKANNKYSGTGILIILGNKQLAARDASKSEIKKYLKDFSDIDSLSGTIVIWEKIDQIKGSGRDRISDQNTKINLAMDH